MNPSDSSESQLNLNFRSSLTNNIALAGNLTSEALNRTCYLIDFTKLAVKKFKYQSRSDSSSSGRDTRLNTTTPKGELGSAIISTTRALPGNLAWG